MSTIEIAPVTVALEDIEVPENVRQLDEAHVAALAGSIELQGLVVPLVVRRNGERYQLVAGFHRIAAARKLGLAEVPVVVREGETEDADRAVENITSCRRRHDVIYADRVVMPMSESKCPTLRCEPGGGVGIKSGRIQAVRVNQTTWLRRRLPLGLERRDRHAATRSRFVHCRRFEGLPTDAPFRSESGRWATCFWRGARRTSSTAPDLPSRWCRHFRLRFLPGRLCQRAEAARPRQSRRECCFTRDCGNLRGPRSTPPSTIDLRVENGATREGSPV